MTLEIQVPDYDSDNNVVGINWLMGISIFNRVHVLCQRNWQQSAHKTKTKLNKNRTQYVLDTAIRKQTQIT
jgi:hypothetical protein